MLDPQIGDKRLMSDIHKPKGDVLRRNPERECGTPVGQVAVKIQGVGMEVISFYCNKRRLHTDGCEFVGNDVVVRARRREDGRDSIGVLRPGS